MQTSHVEPYQASAGGRVVAMPGGVLVVRRAGLEATVHDAHQSVGELPKCGVIYYYASSQGVVAGAGPGDAVVDDITWTCKANPSPGLAPVEEAGIVARRPLPDFVLAQRKIARPSRGMCNDPYVMIDNFSSHRPQLTGLHLPAVASGHDFIAGLIGRDGVVFRHSLHADCDTPPRLPNRPRRCCPSNMHQLPFPPSGNENPFSADEVPTLKSLREFPDHSEWVEARQTMMLRTHLAEQTIHRQAA